jgi:hypothetical protein
LGVELDNFGMRFGKAEQAFVKQRIDGIDEFFHGGELQIFWVFCVMNG